VSTRLNTAAEVIRAFECRVEGWGEDDFIDGNEAQSVLDAIYVLQSDSERARRALRDGIEMLSHVYATPGDFSYRARQWVAAARAELEKEPT